MAPGSPLFAPCYCWVVGSWRVSAARVSGFACHHAPPGLTPPGYRSVAATRPSGKRVTAICASSVAHARLSRLSRIARVRRCFTRTRSPVRGVRDARTVLPRLWPEDTIAGCVRRTRPLRTVVAPLRTTSIMTSAGRCARRVSMCLRRCGGLGAGLLPRVSLALTTLALAFVAQALAQVGPCRDSRRPGEAVRRCAVRGRKPGRVGRPLWRGVTVHVVCG